LPVQLLAAMDHTSCTVLAQTQVDAKTNEITQFRPLLDRLDLADTVVTAGALHTRAGARRVAGHPQARRLQVTTIAGLDLPHATQALRITAGSARSTSCAGGP
jgi:hypothetical protein